jgi:replicative DNA helicase
MQNNTRDHEDAPETGQPGGSSGRPAMDGLDFDDVTGSASDGTDAGATGGPSPLLRTADLLRSVLKDLADRHKTQQGGGWTGGLRCGIPLIDKDLRGLRPKSITALCAEPKLGKTTLANQIAYQTAAFPGQDSAALYVSFELEPADLILKLLSRLSEWALTDLLDGRVAPDDPHLVKAARLLAGVPLCYLRGGPGTTPDGIIQRSKEAAGGGPLLLVIDYLQYFARFARAGTQYEQLSQTLPELRRIADETGAAMIVIAAQNRETNKDGKVTQFGSTGGGGIEYDVDAYLVLTKDLKRIPPPGMVGCRLSVANARYGGGDAECEFDYDRDRAHFRLAEGGNGC